MAVPLLTKNKVNFFVTTLTLRLTPPAPTSSDAAGRANSSGAVCSSGAAYRRCERSSSYFLGKTISSHRTCRHAETRCCPARQSRVESTQPRHFGPPAGVNNFSGHSYGSEGLYPRFLSRFSGHYYCYHHVKQDFKT